MHDITTPLRLAVGSHRAGSGKGCAMNVISWENGDATITDLPACSDPFLARVVQHVNDAICSHRTGDLLCPDCSVKVLDLGHRTVGTSLPGIDPKVYVTIAVEEAESVLGHSGSSAPRQACALVRRFLAGDAVTSRELRDSAAAHAAAHAADAAAHAAAAAVHAAAVHAAAAAVHAADARLTRAHRVIDRFLELTGTQPVDVPTETTARAVASMLAAANA